MSNTFLQTPPMGWNSWDCYGASVREDEVDRFVASLSTIRERMGYGK